MHSTEVGANSVPAFLSKLWKLVEDQECDDLICWGSSGNTFIIRNPSRFAKELLPLYFKHNHMASFIRQLNMYGFRKVLNIEQGGMRCESDAVEFQHPWFLKEHETYLDQIKRKIPVGKAEDVKAKSQLVNTVMGDIDQIRGKQETMDTNLATMKRENEALWREVANLRQKHNKQQQIVNKLIQFLLSMVQPNRGINLKRKIPLMFNEGAHDSKSARLSRHYSFDPATKSGDAPVRNNDGSDLPLSGGPVIHDVTDSLASQGPNVNGPAQVPSAPRRKANDVAAAAATFSAMDPVALAATEMLVPVEEVLDALDANATPSPQVQSPPPSVAPATALLSPDPIFSVDEVLADFIPLEALEKVPKSDEEEGDNDDANNLEPALETVMDTLVGTSSAAADPTMDVAVPSPDLKWMKTDIADHVDVTQSDLEGLRELLSTSGISINASALLEVCSDSLLNSFLPDEQLFNQDDPMPSTSFSSPSATSGDRNAINGTEVVQYNPSLLELTEDDAYFFEDGGSSYLFDNVDAVLADDDDPTTTTTGAISDVLQTPDPLLCAPEFPTTTATRKRGRPKKAA